MNSQSSQEMSNSILHSDVAMKPHLTIATNMDEDAVSIGDSIGNSDAWCDCSVASQDSMNEGEDPSIASKLSSDTRICLDDWKPIENLEPVKIEAIIWKHAQAMAQTDQRSIAPATVVSSGTSDLSQFDPFVLHMMKSDAARSGNLTSGDNIISNRADFSMIPDDLLCELFSFLPVDALLNLQKVSRRFKKASSRDEAGWANHCVRLWKNKIHVSWVAMEHRNGSNSMLAYKTSCQDVIRQEVLPTELCFDPQSGRGTIWSFRFKDSAGLAWTSSDPWYAGSEAREMIFLRDGTVKQVVRDANASNGAFRIEHPFYDTHGQQVEGIVAPPLPIQMKWRFLLEPMDMPSRPRGAYLRLNVAGRDVPTYVVRRSPTGNWGFVMENCWGVFASFPLPKRQTPSRAASPRPTRMRLRRTSTGGVRWLNVGAIESDSDSDDDMEVDGNQERNDDAVILSDRALPTTSRRQWREALLYNYGAIILPEGEGARNEFDRIFDSFQSPVESLNHGTVPTGRFWHRR